jgi:hypothetical protein
MANPQPDAAQDSIQTTSWRTAAATVVAQPIVYQHIDRQTEFFGTELGGIVLSLFKNTLTPVTIDQCSNWVPNVDFDVLADEYKVLGVHGLSVHPELLALARQALSWRFCPHCTAYVPNSTQREWHIRKCQRNPEKEMVPAAQLTDKVESPGKAIRVAQINHPDDESLTAVQLVDNVSQFT